MENSEVTTLERQDYRLEVEEVPLWLAGDALGKIRDMLDGPDLGVVSATLVIELQNLQAHEVERIQKELRKAFTVFNMSPS
jgi:hypothetical protein